MQRRLERAIEELRFGEVEGIFDLMITNESVDPAYQMLRDFIVEVIALSLPTLLESDTV